MVLPRNGEEEDYVEFMNTTSASFQSALNSSYNWSTSADKRRQRTKSGQKSFRMLHICDLHKIALHKGDMCSLALFSGGGG